METNKIIRKSISYCFVIFAIVIKAQDTFSEFDKTNEGFEIEKIKNADLKLIKEIIRDKSGKVLKYYNYNPATGELDGDFDNGLFKGNYNNKRISSDNYIHFLNPSNNNEVLLIKGKIISGKLDGRYNIIKRLYDTETQYDHNSTIVNSYIKGEYTKSYATYVNRNKFNDKIVGEVVFSNGLYSSFALIYKGKKYLANYKDGLLDYYVVKDSENNRAIDSIKVGGRIYLKQGEFHKNILPSIADSLNKIIEPSGLDFNYERMGFKNIDVARYFKESQIIPIVNPLKLEFNMINKTINYKINNGGYWFIRFFGKDLDKINFIPTTFDERGGGEGPFLTGVLKRKSNYFQLPSELKILKCYSDNFVYIPFLEYSIQIQEIVDLYGTDKGYDFLNKNIYEDLSGDLIKFLNKNYSKEKIKNVTYSYLDESILCNNIGNTINIVDKIESVKKSLQNQNTETIENNLNENQTDEEDVFTIVEKQAEFPGGIAELGKFISKNLQYPTIAREKGLSGVSVLTFIIKKDGKIGKVQIMKSFQGCPDCDREAIRLVQSMPNWKPAEMSSRAVSSVFNLPIRFKIQQ